jgi:hypothetical protein
MAPQALLAHWPIRRSDVKTQRSCPVVLPSTHVRRGKSTSSSAPVDGCTDAEFFIETTPNLVEISVDAQDGSWMGAVNVSPSYEALEPNGPGCPPVCQVAELSVVQQ